jgi:hypothetical protein
VFGEGLRGGSEGGSGASRLEPVPELVPKVVPSWFPPTGTGSGACVVPRIPPPSQGGPGNHHATGDFSGEILFPVSGRNGGIPIPVNGRSRAHRVDAPGRDLAICESRNDSACRGPFQPVDRPVPARLVAPAYLFGARLDFQSTRTTPRSAQNRIRRSQLATRWATRPTRRPCAPPWRGPVAGPSPTSPRRFSPQSPPRQAWQSSSELAKPLRFITRPLGGHHTPSAPTGGAASRALAMCVADVGPPSLLPCGTPRRPLDGSAVASMGKTSPPGA